MRNYGHGPSTLICPICNTGHGGVCSPASYRGYALELDADTGECLVPGIGEGGSPVRYDSYAAARRAINDLVDGPEPVRARTQVCHWPLGDDQMATTVHRVSDDGEETIELSGIHPRMRLQLEDRGHEMVLAERGRKGVRA